MPPVRVDPVRMPSRVALGASMSRETGAGVGYKTNQMLAAMEVHSVADMRARPPQHLERVFGSTQGRMLHLLSMCPPPPPSPPLTLPSHPASSLGPLPPTAVTFAMRSGFSSGWLLDEIVAASTRIRHF